MLKKWYQLLYNSEICSTFALDFENTSKYRS